MSHKTCDDEPLRDCETGHHVIRPVKTSVGLQVIERNLHLKSLKGGQVDRLEEAALILSLKEGRADGYRTLVSEHGDRVYNTVLSMMQHPEDAEDVVQEVFVSVYQNIGRFRGDAKLSTWIYRTAVTKSLEALRRSSKKNERRTDRLDDETGRMHVASFHHPGVMAENRERAAVLFGAMNQLPEKQRTAFVLHKTEGLSYAEIAEVMELTLPSVESLIYRARQGLQKLLVKYYKET